MTSHSDLLANLKSIGQRYVSRYNLLSKDIRLFEKNSQGLWKLASEGLVHEYEHILCWKQIYYVKYD